MIAQIISIVLDATQRSQAGKTLTGVEVTYKGLPYKGQEKEPTTRFLFSTNPVAQQLDKYKAGDWVEITFDTDRWKTPLTIAPTAPPTEGGEAKPKSASGGGGGWGKSDPETQRNIARAVALKEAVGIVTTQMQVEGTLTKKALANEQLLADTAINTAKQFEAYLLGETADGVDDPPFDTDELGQGKVVD